LNKYLITEKAQYINMHAATKAKEQIKGRLRMNITFSKSSPPIVELFGAED
jgi:hypothetical protein